MIPPYDGVFGFSKLGADPMLQLSNRKLPCSFFTQPSHAAATLSEEDKCNSAG